MSENDLLQFEVVDGRRPCVLVEYRPATDSWSAEIAAWATAEDVPMTFASFVEKGIRHIDDAWTRRWAEERFLPPGRQNLGEILKVHGLDHYDMAALLGTAGRISSQDYFVVRGPVGAEEAAEHGNATNTPLRSLGKS